MHSFRNYSESSLNIAHLRRSSIFDQNRNLKLDKMATVEQLTEQVKLLTATVQSQQEALQFVNSMTYKRFPVRIPLN